MNQRFRELMDQAGGEFYNGFLGSPNSIKFTEEDFEKFAELIVRECIEEFAFSVTDNVEIIQDRFTQCRKVAKHFGVEE